MRWTSRFALLSLLLVPFVGCNRRGQEEPLVAGHVAPLSGLSRTVGEHQKQGMRLALKEVNEKGIAGHPLAVIHADSEGRPEQAHNEAVRLITVNRVIALLGGRPESVAKLAVAVQPYPVPLLTTSSLQSPAARDGIFSLDVTPEFRGETLARFADEELKADRAVVLLDESRPASAAAAYAFERKFRAGDRNTVTAHPFDPRAPRKKLAHQVGDAEVLVFAGTARDFTDVRSTLREDKKSPKIIFAGSPNQWARVVTDPEASAGVYAATVYAPKHFTEEGKNFITEYRKAQNEKPDQYAYEGYELAKVLAEGLRGTGGVGGSRLREELGREHDFQGLTGKFTFKNGHAVRPLYVVQVGKEAEVKEYKPGS
jgi:branched-chain amino acid transport system substrate-binding protein